MKERKAVVKSGKPAVASWAAWLCRSMNILISIREKRMNTAVTNAPQYTEVSRAIFRFAEPFRGIPNRNCS